MNHDTLLTITERTALLETLCTARLHADGEHAFRGACVVSVDLDRAYTAVESLIAAREAALREQIAGQIEAQCEADEPPCLGCWTAAKVARGGT